MIDQVVILLKDQLNGYLGEESARLKKDKVCLLDGNSMDPIKFQPEAISTLLVNLGEEVTKGSTDRYQRVLPDGSMLGVRPEFRLHLYVLFVARFKQYKDGLHYLSLVLRYFQDHHLLDRQNAPTLSAGIEKLIIELVTLPFSEQNEIWSALRTPYHPSALYRVKLVAVRDDGAADENGRL